MRTHDKIESWTSGLNPVPTHCPRGCTMLPMNSSRGRSEQGQASTLGLVPFKGRLGAA